MRDRIWFMALVLGGLGGLAGLGLSAVHGLTAPVIERRVLERRIGPALADCFGPLGVDNDYIAERVVLDLGADDWGRKVRWQVFVGRRGGAPAAAALRTVAVGWGGEIEVLTAFDLESGEIIGARTLAHKETAGLGSRVADDDEPFVRQFAGLAFDEGVELEAAGGRVEAISGATISSEAFTRAVDTAARLMRERRDEILE